MSSWRMVVRHARYWRGNIHKWSTVYPFVGSLATADQAATVGYLYNMEQAVNYGRAAEKGGGIYEISLYSTASGGVPIYTADYFPAETPSSWIDYTATCWPDVTHALETAAEVAMDVEWAAGLSSSGKPVKYRKWYHSVPVSTSSDGAADIASGTITAVQNEIQSSMAAIAGKGLLLGSGSRLAATVPTVAAFYGNHQMPRGRRKVVRPGSVFDGLSVSEVGTVVAALGRVVGE